MNRNLARYFAPDREVADALKLATINIRERHIPLAVPKRGDACVAAYCTLQSLDASRCWFYTSVCYIEVGRQ